MYLWFWRKRLSYFILHSANKVFTNTFINISMLVASSLTLISSCYYGIFLSYLILDWNNWRGFNLPALNLKAGITLSFFGSVTTWQKISKRKRKLKYTTVFSTEGMFSFRSTELSWGRNEENFLWMFE